jgi:iron complex outermembrane receptor protein
MFKNSKLATSVKLACVLGSALAVSASNLAMAQEATNDKAAEEAVEKISVTGSRIARAELSTPAPIVSIGAEQLARFDTPDLGSILAELPAVGAGSTLIGNNNSNANAGLSSPDLRNLGENRTLTLVNGKRHVAGAPGSSAVDTGTVPVSLIKTVEVVTGGASAVYGSDAIAGVINLVMRDDYEGFEVNAQGSTDTNGIGVESFRYNFLAGANTDDGRGNVTFFVENQRISEVLIPDLQQARAFGTVINPDDTAEDDGVADRLTVPFVGSEFINNFTVLNAFGGGPRITFNPDGSPVDQVSRDLTNSFAFGNFTERFDTVFFGEDFENFTPKQDRVTVASTFKYDISDNVRVYGDIKYVDTDIEQQFQPSFRFGNITIDVEDNAFLDPATRGRLLEGGQTSVSAARFFTDIGNRSASNDRSMFRVVTGFEGFVDVGETMLDYDISYNYGQTDNTRRTLNDLIPTNFAAAVDSVIDPETGLAACRSQVPSAQGEGYEDPALVNGGNCAPLNIFGFNQGSDAAKDFVSGNVTREDSISQEVFLAQFSFDTSAFFELQGGAIGVAFGYENRTETSETTTDEFTKAGFFLGAATPDEEGSFDVDEFFMEVRLPILADMEFAKELSVDAAFRTADYSHAGTADAWQVGLVYAPFDDVRVRAQIGEAVRAPNVSEAFSPQSPGFANINDPCDADNISEDPDRAANCAALGIPTGFQANDNVSIDIISGGNPDLDSETAKSFTYGVVYTPTFLENFSVTVDYYDIEVEDAITFIQPQDILDLCVDGAAGLDAAFCGQITRDPTTNDVDLVTSGFANAGARTSRGVDFQVRYLADLADFGLDLPGEVRFNVFGTRNLELNLFAFQDRPNEADAEAGEVGDSRDQLNTSVDYNVGDWNFNWSSRFLERAARFDVTPEALGGAGSTEDLDIPFVGSIWTHDLGVRYNVNDDTSVFLNMRNVFDKTPPGYTFNPLYDLVGRRITASVRMSF